ncbi:MAG: M23 family metallopeptidase [Clostridia bacterium]|nr:M23 family metallopeptidase [Clostridia bacterium]
MSNEKNTHKRKVLFRYLILAACILLIAAVTVITVCAVNDWFRPQITIDSGDVNKPDTPVKPVDPDKPDEPDQPTNTDTTAVNPVSSMDVTNVFDFHRSESLMGAWFFHTGIDMAANVGDKIVASLDGTVESITVDDKLDATAITLVHEGGVKTTYKFINVKEGLKKGDKVKRGEQIGTVAEPSGSEYKQGAHLHFEVEKGGELIDPAEFLNIDNK